MTSFNMIRIMLMMTQVSRFLIRPDVWDRIFNLFIDTFAGLTDKKKLSAFVDSFFTPTEKIMFAKRLAASVMLAKGQDYRSICRVLRISPMSVSRMSVHLKYANDGLSPVINDVLKKDSAKIMWEEIASIFELPGKGRSLRSLGEIKREREKKIRQLKSEF